jgi:AAA domain
MAIEARVRGTSEKRLLAGRRNGAWLGKQKFEPLQFVVDGLLPEGYVVLAGSPFTGKTVLMLRIGLEVADGGSVFGIEVKQRHVFYLALETSEPRLQDSCHQLFEGYDLPEWFEYVTELPPKRLIPEVEKFLREYPDALILIDTLGRVMEPPQRGETPYDRDYRIGAMLKDLDKKYTGCTIIASRHTRKGKADDWLELVSGTNAVTGAADTTLILIRPRGDQNGKLMVASRVMDEAEYALYLERPLGWQLNGDNLEEAADKAKRGERQRIDRRGDRSMKIIDFVNAHPNGVTAKMVVKKFKAEFEKDGNAEFNERTASTYMSQANQRKDIRRIAVGLYGPLNKQKVSKADDDE